MKQVSQTYNLTIENQFSEVYKLQNKMHRYQRRLLKEGFKIGKENNIAFIIKNLDKEYADVSPIIELAKSTLPSLYRRFMQLTKKFVNGVEDLEEKLKD